MVSAVSAAPATERVAFGKLLWVGPLTIVAAVAANAIVRLLAAAVLQPDPRFMPLSMAMPIVFTTIGALGAVLVYAAVGRFAARPIRLYQRIALVALIVSFVPDFLLLGGGMPGANLATVGALILMHVVAWAVCVRLLTTLARA